MGNNKLNSTQEYRRTSCCQKVQYSLFIYLFIYLFILFHFFLLHVAWDLNHSQLLLLRVEADKKFSWNTHQSVDFCIFNPLTPVPPVTARDEPWPFFLFWRHHFLIKTVASSIFNFCRRERSIQWCPDQSDQPNGALDMHKNVQKV